MRPTAEPRFKRRIPCKLNQSSRATSGVVLDLSRGGLFVQTAVSARAGEEMEIVLHAPAGREDQSDIVLNAQVVWQRRVPVQLRNSMQSGVGLKIRYASEGYYALLAETASGR